MICRQGCKKNELNMIDRCLLRKAGCIAAFLFFIATGCGVASGAGLSGQAAKRPAATAVKEKAVKEKMENTENTFKTPDFAFPQTVGDNAGVALEKALATGDDVAALRAAMQKVIADNLVSKENLDKGIALFRDLSEKLSSPFSSLALLLESELYCSVYRQTPWVYNNRAIPLTPVPEDITAWSRDIFSAKVASVVSEAFQNTGDAREMPLSSIQEIISDWKDAADSGMTVYDFMVLRGVSQLRNFAGSNVRQIIPFGTSGHAGSNDTERSAYGLMTSLLEDDIDMHLEAGDMQLASAMSYFRYDILPVSERRDYLEKCIRRFSDTPYCASFLYASCFGYAENDMLGNEEERLASENKKLKECHALLRAYLEKFPECVNSSALRSRLDEMEAPQVTIEVAEQLLPGVETKVGVKGSNIYSFYIVIARMPDSYSGKNADIDNVKKSGKYVASVPVSLNGSVPQISETVLHIPALDAGVYVVFPSKTPSLSGLMSAEKGRTFASTVLVSGISAFRTTEGDDNYIYVVDARNQQPVSGAKVRFYTDKRSIVRQTDAAGKAVIPDGFREASVVRGKDRVQLYVYNGKWNYTGEKVDLHGSVFTDRSIYRPGDKVGFLGVVYRKENRDMAPKSSCGVDVVLRNANFEAVDTLKNVVTDAFGRVEGEFTLPETGLLGNYSIHILNGEESVGSAYFSVAEYKSPSFYVEVDGTTDGYRVGDVVTVKGKVLTYSGMPLGGAKVNYGIRYVPVRWMPDPVNAVYGGTAETAPDGTFEIVLPTGGLKGTRFACGGYELDVSAVSPSGETQSAPVLWFSIGEAYAISPSLPDRIKAGKEDKPYTVNVNDIIGKPVRKTVYYRVLADIEGAEPLLSGHFESPVFRFDAGRLPSGRYKVEYSLDREFSNTGNMRPSASVVTVYRSDDKVPPYTTPLWCPEREIVVPSVQKSVNIKVGSSYPDSWIYAQISDCDRFVESRWLRVSDGMVALDVSSPAAASRVKVTFGGMHDLSGMSDNVLLIPEEQKQGVEITAASFRDRIASGSRESWRFRFNTGGRNLSGIPVSAVMTDKSLDALVPFRWHFDPYTDIYYPFHMNYVSRYIGRRNLTVALTKKEYVPLANAADPRWNLYGYSGLCGGMEMYKMKARGAMAMTNSAVSNAQEYSSGAEGGAVKEEMAVDRANVYMDAADAAPTISAGNGALEENPDGKENVREMECPVAFFKPMLVTDRNGDVIVDFTVPDFNGTWQFQIMGYTDSMKGSVKMLEAVASKPVMASLNAPRFVRTGDEMYVTAMLYNNTAESADLYGKIELFDPVSGRVLKTFVSQPAATAPAGSSRIGLSYTVGFGINSIGLRVYACGDRFSDGEQTVIPVYPSSTPVLESEPFYLAPGEKEFSMKLPDAEKNGKLTLQYCDNPVWEVVTALPDLTDPDSENVLSLVYSLYGNAIGSGLVKEYPEIGEAIRMFSDPANSADSTLVSNLEKNGSLKNVALENTPWVRSAASETLRMSRLMKYSDAIASGQLASDQFRRLSEMRNADGGWSWCKGMKSSEFITSRVLLHLAMLRDMGYMPKEWNAMAADAVRYADRCWVKMHEEYEKGKFPYISMLDYLYVRSNFKDVAADGSFAAMERKGIQAVKEGWKGLDIYGKATAAILLSRSGYGTEARTILESLRQYSSFSKEKGMWFDNISSGISGWNRLITTTQVLEAYASIDPESASVDSLRQWLLVTKQAENWGDNRSTAEVIHAVLASGTKWTVPSLPPRVYINGTQANVGRIAALTGSFILDIDSGTGGELKIERDGSGPAYGGVVSQYVLPVRDVKAASVPQLSVRKNIYVIRDSADGTSASADGLTVGDKVRVTLTLTCDRDLDYVAVTDSRAACLEPSEQVSGYTVSDGVGMYREVRDNATNLFIPFLSKGTHVISYECRVDRSGEYSLGIASAQSQYSPVIAAHSAGRIIVSRDL